MGIYKDKVFPWLVDHVEGKELIALRKECIAAAQGDVLEIGFGTGSSIEYYTDKVTSLTAVEPSDAMNIRSEHRIEGFSKPFRLVSSSGEHLPLDDESFDSVVIMLTLCSVENPKKVLDEVFRALRSGGKYHFLEHVASDQSSVLLWQNRLNGFSRFVGCGCNLNRNIKAQILESGFQITTISQEGSSEKPLFPSLHPMIHGAAVKP